MFVQEGLQFIIGLSHDPLPLRARRLRAQIVRRTKGRIAAERAFMQQADDKPAHVIGIIPKVSESRHDGPCQVRGIRGVSRISAHPVPNLSKT